MNNLARCIALILILTALPFVASGNTETLITVNQNPVGTTLSSQRIPHLLKAQTHLLLHQDSYTMAQQILATLRTSASLVGVAFLPYYIAAVGEVVLRQPSAGSHSYITDFFAVSAMTLESQIRAFFILINLKFYFNYLTSTLSEYVDRENKILACDAQLPRKGIMPVYPEHPWLASHYYQQVVFPEDQKPFLEINILNNTGNSAEIDTPEDIPEWVNLYQTLSDNRMDKLTIQIQGINNNLLKLMMSGDQVSEEINLLIDAEADVQWDLETITTLCSHFQEDKVYSLFHGQTLKAVNRAIENTMSGNTAEREVFSPPLTDVLKSQKGAAVIGLSSSQNNPVSRLVYSDHDLFTHHPGFLLLTDSSQHSENLFSLALSTTSDRLATGISSQKIWRQDHINDLMSLLQMGTGHLFYHSTNTYLARSSNFGATPSPQQSNSFKNSLSNVRESTTQLSKRSAVPVFFRSLTHNFKEMAEAGKSPLRNRQHRQDVSEAGVDSGIIAGSHVATPLVSGERTVNKHIKYGDKFIMVNHLFDEDLLKMVNEEVDKDRRLFDADFLKSEIDKSTAYEFEIPKNDVFDRILVSFQRANIRHSTLLHSRNQNLISHFDENGKIKEKEAFKKNIIHTRSEAVKELCCQALEKMADSLDWSGKKVENIKFWIIRYPSINADSFEGFFFTPRNVVDMPWHRDKGLASLVVQLNDNDCEIEYSGGGLNIGQSSSPEFAVDSPDEGTKETHRYKRNCGFIFTNRKGLVHQCEDIDFKSSNGQKKVAEKRIMAVLADDW